MPQMFSDRELAQLRADTPASGGYAHFAHGSSSLPPSAVFNAQRRWLDSEQQHGNYRCLQLFRDELTSVRASVARMIGAEPHQIAFVDSSSRGWALALAAACDAARPVEVITTEHEWGGNVINLMQDRHRGRICGLHVLHDGPTSAAQQVVAQLAHLDDASLAVVSLQAVNPIDGNITQMHGIAQAVQARDGLLFIDASQAVGQLPVDVKQLQCDVLVFPSRKWLRGPKGISVLYLSDRALATLGEPPTLDIASARWQSPTDYLAHADARRFELYEFAPGMRLALQAACEYLMAVGPERIAAHNRLTREKLASALQGIPALQALPCTRPSALMTYRINPAHAAQLLATLEAAGINANLITAQYARWALSARNAEVVLRFTPHYITSDAEIERLVSVLSSLPATFAL